MTPNAKRLLDQVHAAIFHVQNGLDYTAHDDDNGGWMVTTGTGTAKVMRKLRGKFIVTCNDTIALAELCLALEREGHKVKNAKVKNGIVITPKDKSN